MAIERVVRKTCDRCGRMIEEAATDVEPKHAVPELPLLYVEARGLGIEEPIRLIDLDDKCRKRVIEIVSQLRLSGRESKEEQEAEDAQGAEGFREPPTPEEAPPTRTEEPTSPARRRRRDAADGAA